MLLLGVSGVGAAAPSVPSLTSLVAHWKLNEANGTRVDSHGDNDLADNNTVGTAAGKIGDAALFDSANSEWLDVADNAALSMGNFDFTIAAWLYLSDKSVIRGAIHKGTTDFAGATEYLIRYNNGNDRLEFLVGDSALNEVQLEANDFGIPPLDTWMFVVAWHDATANTVNIQVDDGTVTSAGFTFGSHDGAEAFNIGRAFNSFASDYWDGRIDSVSIWKRVLTSVERTALYALGNGLDYPFIPP